MKQPKIFISFQCYELIFLAYTETRGVWAHAYDDSEVTWFSPKFTCECSGDGDMCLAGGNAIRLDITSNSHYTGAWCDRPNTDKLHFICEGMI